MKQKKIDIRDMPSGACEPQLLLQYFSEFLDDFSEQKVFDLIDSRCVSDLGFQERELTKNGVFQILLLQTEPFNFDGSLTEHKDKIMDVRNEKKFPCQDRPKLLEHLASILSVDHDQHCRLSLQMDIVLEWSLIELEDIKQVFISYFDLKDKELITSKEDVKGMQKKVIDAAFKMIEDILRSLSERDSELIVKDLAKKYPRRYKSSSYSEAYKAPPSEEKPPLIEWRDSFTCYGPKRYSLDAIFHAIATILVTFGIEEGERKTVAGRIRKRLQRLSK